MHGHRHSPYVLLVPHRWFTAFVSVVECPVFALMGHLLSMLSVGFRVPDLRKTDWWRWPLFPGRAGKPVGEDTYGECVSQAKTWLREPVSKNAHIGRVLHAAVVKTNDPWGAAGHEKALSVISGRTQGLGRGQTHYQAVGDQ